MKGLVAAALLSRDIWLYILPGLSGRCRELLLISCKALRALSSMNVYYTISGLGNGAITSLLMRGRSEVRNILERKTWWGLTKNWLIAHLLWYLVLELLLELAKLVWHLRNSCCCLLLRDCTWLRSRSEWLRWSLRNRSATSYSLNFLNL